MADDNGSQNGAESNRQSLLDDLRIRRAYSDVGREPEFVAGRLGTRMISWAAVIERIVAEFVDEHTNEDRASMREDSDAERLKQVLR